MRRRVHIALLAAVLTIAGLGTLPAAAVAPPTSAPSAPGSLSHFDLARKDCLGTASNTTSKIWYTVANGVLSDVYAPTIDTTNVETMQFLVSDGRSFTDLQTRDMTYTASADSTGMTCTVTSTAKSGKYRLTTTYLTDTFRSSVVVHTRYTALTKDAGNFRLYVRLDPTVGGNGGGGSGTPDSGTSTNGGADSATIDRSTGSAVPVSFDTVTTTNAANRDYAVPSYLALRADKPFNTVSSGFVGTESDGLTQLDAAHALAPQYDDATGGNVEQTAALQLGRDGSATIALGFGTTQAAAVATAGATVGTSISSLVSRYQGGWQRYDSGLNRPSSHLPGLTKAQQAAAVKEYYLSANVLKSSEDKTFPGAIVASMASPWGQAVSAGDPNNTYFGSYREVFARDLYEAFTGLLTDGDLSTARATTRFLLLQQQQPDGSMPRNSLLNGKTAPDSFNNQLDEDAYPILMALQSGLGGDKTLWPHIKSAANFLISHGPASIERWEEQNGYSPSTIAAEIAGLVAAGTIAKQHRDSASARVWLATADQYQRRIKGWTVTTNGPLSADPYFIRVAPTGDPNAADVKLSLANGGPTLDQRSVIDAGFLELVRLGAFPASDPDVQNSLKVVDATILKQTPSGPGWLRYNGDGYGDCNPSVDNPCAVAGAPWAPSDKGTGHVWPVLSAERGEQEMVSGHRNYAGELLAAIDNMSSGVGLVPEQDWDTTDLAASAFGTDPTTASIGFVNGKPAGSAAPLTWGSASQVRLVADLSARKVLEQPTQTVDRYIKHTQGATTLTVTAPADGTVAKGVINVTGTAAKGATVDVANVAVDGNSVTAMYTTKVDSSGAFSIPVTVVPGANSLVVTATATNGGTAQQVVNVLNDVVVGTLLYDKTDPTGDDNGPGNYAYPTPSNVFHPGAFDLTDFQVYDTGTTVTFRAQTGDLTPTFGSPLGAQLLDLYVTVPGVTPTSTNASFTSRNYQLATPWNRLLEVQGFGQRFVDATGATLGTISISARSISRYITFSVPKAALGGTPSAGWSYALTLTGQDGFSSDQARGFQPLPQDYQFGECATASSDHHCTAPTSTLPKVMDTLTPDGVAQSDELDYIKHQSVVIAAVTQ